MFNIGDEVYWLLPECGIYGKGIIGTIVKEIDFVEIDGQAITLDNCFATKDELCKKIMDVL